MDEVRRSLPDDLVIGTTSDQQRQVREKLDLFNRSLWEAVVLVVLVSFVGFWEWRSALLMALCIPITLAMTFGLMQLVGLDIQQMSIASLIIALGLLVDDPVVAGDAIKRELAHGHDRSTAAWLGPDKLSKAILYATITNIAAYLPFLLLSGDVGRFIYSLPVTIACSLVASRARLDDVSAAAGILHLEARTRSDGATRRARVDSAGSTSARSRSRSIIGGRASRPRRWSSPPEGSSPPSFTGSSFPETTFTSPMWMFVSPRTHHWRRPPMSRARRIG